MLPIGARMHGLHPLMHRTPGAPYTPFRTPLAKGTLSVYHEAHQSTTGSRGIAMDTSHRYRGALLGLAAGDALGTTIEFCPPGTFAPVEDITAEALRPEPGQWTDDTSMASLGREPHRSRGRTLRQT